MDIISFGKQNKSKETTEPKEAKPIILAEKEFSIKLPQYFGIINVGNRSTILIGPYDKEEETFSILLKEVNRLMEDPVTELLVSEDSAAVYTLIESELFVVKEFDISSILDEEDEE